MTDLMTDIPVSQLTIEEADLERQCVQQITSHLAINTKRSEAYDAKQFIQHFDIAVPPQMKSLQTVLGWPAKAVDIFESLLELDGFVIPGFEPREFGIDSIEAANRMNIELPQAHTTALKYGCAFLAVTQGGEGEPAAVIRALSPTNSTVLWDRNRRRARAALTMSQDKITEEADFALFLDTHTVFGHREKGLWSVERQAHSLGEVPVTLMAFKPSLEDPFGRSRISQAVLSITARAVRTLLRMEATAEFYSAPQRAILGLGEDDFESEDGSSPDKWVMLMSKMLMLPSNMEGQVPSIQQFAQASMQPHIDMLRSEAALFAGETNIPVNVLGIIHDNPASDAAMHTAYLALNKDAERAQATFGAGVVKAMQLAWRISNGGAELPEPLVKMQANYRDPDTPTKASMSQAVIGQVTAGILPPVSPTTYGLLGYDKPLIESLMAEARRKSNSFSLLDLAAAKITGTEPSTEAPAGSTGEARQAWPNTVPKLPEEPAAK